MHQPAILLLTATITPPRGVPNLKRTDPKQRYEDYVDAFSFYLSLPTEVIDRIVFIENSKSDIDRLRHLAANESNGKQIEFVCFDGLSYPPAYGRAYGEFKMLDYVFRNSLLIKAMEDSNHFWKVTGRLKVFNLPKIIAKAPSNYDLLMDFLRFPTKMTDLRLYSCSIKGYKRLLENVYETLIEANLNMSAESFLYQQWVDKTGQLGIVPRFVAQPRIGGIGGQHNVDYYSGLNVSKHWIRAATRRLVPNLWI